MLVRFMSCRERFRLKYLLGLEMPDRWSKSIGYGNMWHTCEEALAKDADDGTGASVRLMLHTNEQITRYPMQRDEIAKWYAVCRIQFPEYVKYWTDHLDVKHRTPLMQEQVFDVPYPLPSGRTVRLRGKFDSVDLILDPDRPWGVYIQENKTKGDIDKEQVERQLKFDLQTCLYRIALDRIKADLAGKYALSDTRDTMLDRYPILGVRYNVVRRPLSGGVGSISPHKAKSTKTKVEPAETSDEFYERLRRDYIAADPAHWFFRVRSEVSVQDVEGFKRACLTPLLEQLCCWYEQTTTGQTCTTPPMNYRTPFGIYNPLAEDRSTEYDVYLESGSEAGLRRVEELFTELGGVA
jgi:hypothetical protein